MKNNHRSVDLIRTPKRKRKIRKFLIVCEGTKTEVNYFKSFPEKPDVFDTIEIKGIGNNTTFVVNKAIELRDEAIKIAGKNNIKCAYSIECFELWFLLHFNYYDTAMSRIQYYEKLSDLLERPYEKSCEKMFSLLKGKTETAIKNASKLFTNQCKLPYDKQNPVTLVFRLVEKLFQ